MFRSASEVPVGWRYRNTRATERNTGTCAAHHPAGVNPRGWSPRAAAHRLLSAARVHREPVSERTPLGLASPGALRIVRGAMQLGGPKRDDETPQSGPAAAAPTAATAPGGEPRGDLVGAPRPAAPHVGQDDVTKTAASVEADGALSHGDERLPAPLQFRDPDRYEIIAEHGRGGLGRVLRARDKEMGRDVALKEMLRRGHTAEARFFREALITARLEHPGIVPVHEAGRWPDGTPFYAMKLVAGRPLSDLIDEAKTLEQRLALLPHVIAVADAIAYAHERRIIHRDLKPSNVIVGEFGETVVIDWGLAKQLDDDDDTHEQNGPYRSPARDGLTVAGSILGTPAFMAPEQARGERVDERADVYAIGALLAEVVGTPVRDADLATVIRKATAPTASVRYANAAQLAADLRAYAAKQRVAAREYSLAALAALWFRRNRTLATVTAAVALVGLLAAGLLAGRLAKKSREAERARDDAVAALSKAEQERLRATEAHAAALLLQDPTAAWESLSRIPVADSRVALLRARVRAAGIAATVIQPSESRLDGVLSLAPGGQYLAISTVDRRLHIIDLATRSIKELASGLTEPPVFSATETGVFFVAQADTLVLAWVGYDGTRSTLAHLDGLPYDLVSDRERVYWMDAAGRVVTITRFDRTPTDLLDSASQIANLGGRLLACTEAGRLVVLDATKRQRELGACDASSWFSRARQKLLLRVRDDRFTVVSADGATMTITLQPRVNGHTLRVSDDGLIVAATDSKGLFWNTGTGAVGQIAFTSAVSATAAGHGIAAWGFADGTIEAIETETRRRWTLKAHDHGIACLIAIDESTLLSCGRHEIRLWDLPPHAPRTLAVLESAAFNIAVSHDGRRIVDGRNGTVSELPAEPPGPARLLHSHESLAFSVAWCGGKACSGGWDGRILCTDQDRITQALDFKVPVRWLDGDSESCYVATADGTIWKGSGSNFEEVHSHRSEPHRLALSPGGRFIASIDHTGSLIVSSDDGSFLREVFAHASRASSVVWTDESILTSGDDGRIRQWSSSLSLLKEWALGGPVQRMVHDTGIVGAIVSRSSLVVLDLRVSAPKRIDIGATLVSIAVATEGDFVAVGTDRGEVVIVRTGDGALSSWRIGQTSVSCLRFLNARRLLACQSLGEVFEFDVSHSMFVAEK